MKRSRHRVTGQQIGSSTMPQSQNTLGQDEGQLGNGPQANLADAADDLGRQARETAGRVRSELEGTANAQKTVVASLVNDFADVIDNAARHLDQRGQHSAARYAEGMGSSLADFSRTVEQKSLGDMVGDVSDLARKHPAAFVGGAMLLGMALSRVAKAAPSSVTQPFTDKVKSAVSEVKSAVADVSADLASSVRSSNEGLK